MALNKLVVERQASGLLADVVNKGVWSQRLADKVWAEVLLAEVPPRMQAPVLHLSYNGGLPYWTDAIVQQAHWVVWDGDLPMQHFDLPEPQEPQEVAEEEEAPMTDLPEPEEPPVPPRRQRAKTNRSATTDPAGPDTDGS